MADLFKNFFFANLWRRERKKLFNYFEIKALRENHFQQKTDFFEIGEIFPARVQLDCLWNNKPIFFQTFFSFVGSKNCEKESLLTILQKHFFVCKW